MNLLDKFFHQVAEHDGGSGSQDEAKKAAAQRILDLVEPGMTLGLGTGSTVDFFLRGLAEKVRDGLLVTGVPTSGGTERRAKELGIPLKEDQRYPDLSNDLCIDGADRVDREGYLIKGGGGALLREKLVAAHSKRVCILVDPSKLVPVFDDSFPLPVECLTFGIENTLNQLAEVGSSVSLRGADAGEPLLTDNGNFIVDCTFARIPDPGTLGLRLKQGLGIVESGIFTGLLDELVVGFPNGTALHWSRS